MKSFLIFVLLSAVGLSAIVDEEDRLYAEAVTNAKTEKQRTMAIYDQRIHEGVRKKATVLEVFQSENGITQFKAVLLARSYAIRFIGVCSDIDLPELVKSKWVVKVPSIGRLGKPGADIIIDAKTGAIHCLGHPDVLDALAFIKEMDKPRTQKPNHTSEPTPGAVH